MARDDRLRRFNEAMSVVYGPLDHLTDDEAATWIPPDKPGAGGHRGRYLWTDAFGVVNFLTLFRETSSPKYLVLAKRLVAAVHDVLGRTRDGSARLPGATD
ncbi:Vacuolar amino acid transporter 3, partial [Tolypocladium paradoxum]